MKTTPLGRRASTPVVCAPSSQASSSRKSARTQSPAATQAAKASAAIRRRRPRSHSGNAPKTARRATAASGLSKPSADTAAVSSEDPAASKTAATRRSARACLPPHVNNDTRSATVGNARASFSSFASSPDGEHAGYSSHFSSNSASAAHCAHGGASGFSFSSSSSSSASPASRAQAVSNGAATSSMLGRHSFHMAASAAARAASVALWPSKRPASSAAAATAVDLRDRTSEVSARVGLSKTSLEVLRSGGSDASCSARTASSTKPYLQITGRRGESNI